MAEMPHTFIYTWCSIHKRHVEPQVNSMTFRDLTL